MINSKLCLVKAKNELHITVPPDFFDILLKDDIIV